MEPTPYSPRSDPGERSARGRNGASLNISELRVAFGSTAILEIDQLRIHPGEFVAIAGPSGCGKSTLLRIISGLLPAAGAPVEIKSDNVNEVPHIGFVFQDATLLPWRTAASNIALPGELEDTPVTSDRIEELAAFVGLSPNDLRKRPKALSGGMKMRVSLARALALQPDLLLLDEPFAALDDFLRQQLQSDVRRIQKELNLTTILVTHNIAEAVYMSDQVITLGGTPARIVGRTEVALDRSADVRSTPEFAFCVQQVSRSLESRDGEAGV